jgi:hypothetical protein
MQNIHRLIYHIVNNAFPLNEYSTGEMKRLMQHFKDEAEEFDIKIDDDRLEAYINRFDQIKNGLDQKEITRYSLATLLKMLSKDTKTKEKVEVEEDETIEPVEDEVYRNEDNSIVVYYGMNLKDGEPGCVRLKQADEKWCVTRRGNSMWKSYRQRESMGYPSFYLAYNVNLPKSNKLSAVAIQARENNKYAYTDRTNDPGMSGAMSFERLVQEIPWLAEIPNLQSILKWVPLSKEEKREMQGSSRLIDLAAWKNLPYQKKLRYFEDRKQDFNRLSVGSEYSKVFDRITLSDFLQKVLPKYPEVLKHLIDLSVAEDGRVFSPTVLFSAYNFYPEAQKKSLLRHIGAGKNEVDYNYVYDEDLPFDLKQDITNEDGWTKKDDQYILSVPNKDILVVIQKPNRRQGRETRIDLITPEEVFRDRPVNAKTAKYLLQDPNVTKLPFTIIGNAIGAGYIQGKEARSVLGKYLNAKDTSVISRKVGDKQIIFDEKSLTAFELDGDKITKLENPQEFLDSVASTEEQKKSLQTNFFKGLTENPEWVNNDLPDNLDKGSFIALLNSIPYDKRTIDNAILFAVPETDGNEPIVFLQNPNNPNIEAAPPMSWGRGTRSDWYDRNGSSFSYSLGLGGWQQLIEYWRSNNTGLTDQQLKSIMADGEGYDQATRSKYALATANPPMAADTQLKPVIVNDTLWLLNRQNPSDCYSVSPSRGKMTQKAVSAGKIRQALGEPEAAAPQAEPAQGEQPAAQAGEAPAVQQAVAQGDRANVGADLAAAGMNINALPNSVRNRVLRGGVRLATTDERGARSRNQLLGNRGRVTAIYKLDGTASAVYMITLASGTQIASIAMQPGNYQGILAGGRYYNMTSANDLGTTLQARNINESMNKDNIRKIIAEIVREKITANQPAPAKPKENPGPAVAPGKPEEKPGPRRPFIKPDTKPEPKAVFNKMNENERAIVQKIAARFKSKR